MDGRNGDMTDIEVEYLADQPGAVSTLAKWLFQEWRDHSPDGSVEGIAASLRDRMRKDTLPLALVALRKGVPVGTVSLKIREVEIRPRYEHWLGGLYVDAAYRGMGIGSLLISSAEEKAGQLGIERLYLYTRREDTRRLYEKLGWDEVERPEYRGRPAIIMKTVLDT